MPEVAPSDPSRRDFLLWGSAAVVTLYGCGSRRHRRRPDSHVVRPGETLFTIAFRYGRDHRDLARWNRLGDGSLIHPGQSIRLSPPAAAQTSAATTRSPADKPLPRLPVQPAPRWAWPTRGKVDVAFGQRPGSGTGVLIDGRQGQPVVAAAPGRVAYSGDGLKGYGQLLIVKHNDTYLSAYGHNSTLLVKEGQAVRQGQRIATMGEGPGRQPRLHFEIRRNGKPVDPQRLLPSKP